jgi:hypothetical protein
MYSNTKHDIEASDEEGSLVYLLNMHTIDVLYCPEGRVLVFNGKPRPDYKDPWCTIAAADSIESYRSRNPGDNLPIKLQVTMEQLLEVETMAKAAIQLMSL